MKNTAQLIEGARPPGTPERRFGADRTTLRAPTVDEPDTETGEFETVEMPSCSTGEYRAANAALRERAAWFHALALHSGDVILVLDHRGEVRFASGCSLKMLGLLPEELDASTLSRALHPDDRDRFARMFRGLTGRFGDEERIAARLLHTDGHTTHVELLAVNRLADPALEGVVLYVRDVTERMVRDPVTGLPNRDVFLERLQETLDQPVAGFFAVLIVQLERYEFVRASLGARAAGTMMAQMAHRLRALAGDDWVLARVGEREFGVLLRGLTDPSDIPPHADALNRAGGSPFQLDGTHVLSFVNIGIALSTRSYDSADEVLGAASHAVQTARGKGGSTREFATTRVVTSYSARLRLETDLLGALERKEFSLHWQPIAKLASGGLEGFEALIRWQHPVRGNVRPDEFIPVAEESKLIIPIGAWVLRTAIAQLGSWQRTMNRSTLGISVNLSPVQLGEPELVPAVRASLLAHGVAADRVKIEVTETAFVERPEAAAASLEALRALGCRIAMDDFGTGYASLQYLTRFPVDILKIDRSFISGEQGLLRSARGRPLVRTILDLARSLELEVVAEGIETKAELDIVRTMGAQYGQGWLLGRPVPADDALAFMRRIRQAD